MTITRKELLFINSITGGPHPFGIVLARPNDNEVDAYKIEAIKSLREKGILTESGSFTNSGQALLYLWEEYRSAPKHIIFNRILFSINGNQNAVGIGYTEDGNYEILSTDSPTILSLFVSVFPFLLKESNKNEFYNAQITYDEWSQEITDAKGSVFIIGRFLNKASNNENTYYCINNTPYQYNFESSIKREISSGIMYNKITDYLEVQTVKSDEKEPTLK